MTSLRARAHAKINLGLKIVGRRADGYHELRTIFQTLALHDTVALELRPGRGVELAMAGDCDGIAGDGENLACRAAALAAEAFGLRRRIAIRLTKRIPHGAGLGGGSSDAAAVLRLLGAAARRPAGLAQLLPLARQLGADVPFFLWGGTALGLGRGDEVYALPDLAPWHCVLALPAAARVSTAAAFAAWAAGNGSALTRERDSDTIIRFCSLVEQVYPAFRVLSRNRGAARKSAAAPRVQAGIENDFQPGVFSLSPDFPRIHRQLRRASPAWVGLTGSGAAQFALFASAPAAAACAAGLELELGDRCRTWVTRFMGRRPMAGHMPLTHGI